MLLLQCDTLLLLNGDNCSGESSGSMIIPLNISSVVSVLIEIFYQVRSFCRVSCGILG